MLPPLVFAMFLVTMSTRVLGESCFPLGASDSSGRGFNWHCETLLRNNSSGGQSLSTPGRHISGLTPGLTSPGKCSMSVGQESEVCPVLGDSVQHLCISHLEIDRYQRLARREA